jgi:hypothetical protein
MVGLLALVGLAFAFAALTALAFGLVPRLLLVTLLLIIPAGFTALLLHGGKFLGVLLLALVIVMPIVADIL